VGSLQVISADGKGYITVSGQSYRSGHQLQEPRVGVRLAGLIGTGSGAASGRGVFSTLGIKPLAWLVRPQIVGKATVEGVATTRVRAGLDATAMLQDFSRLLGKAGSLGVSGASSLPQSISPGTQRSIAHALGSPSFNLWTGTADKLIRKLTISAVVPVTGATRTALGGMRSANVTLASSTAGSTSPRRSARPRAPSPTACSAPSSPRFSRRSRAA